MAYKKYPSLPEQVWVGYRAEQHSRNPRIEISEVLADLPNGTPQLLCMRPGETTAYLATITMDGSTLVWNINGYDTEKRGVGAIQVLLTESGSDIPILMSQPIPTYIDVSIYAEDAEVPDPWESWLSQILAAASRAESAATRAESADDAVEDAKDQAITAIETKGAETLDSIPSDYTTLSGDVSDLKSAFAKYVNVENWEQGLIRPSNGTETDSNTRCRTKDFIYGADLFYNGKAFITVKDGYTINLLAYSKPWTSTDVFVGAVFSKLTGGKIVLNEGSASPVNRNNYYRLIIAKTDNIEFTPSDIDKDAVIYPYHLREISGVERNNTFGNFYRLRFYVPVDMSNYGSSQDIKTVRCIVQIPAGYNPEGKPTPLIMYGHGGSGFISEGYWDNSHDRNDMIDTICAEGYAVFDVNNTLDITTGASVADEGCLTLMASYLKAWEHLKEHYNFSKDLYLWSCSMGSFASLNMLKWYGANIKTAILTAVRVSIGEIYDRMSADNQQHIADVFSWPDGITNYNDAKDYMYGWDDILDVYTDTQNVKRVNHQFPPIKVMVGTADTNQLTDVREYFGALRKNGNVVMYSEFEGADHSAMCYLTGEGMREEALQWIKRFTP